MVAVFADIVKVIMLATGANTLLRVDGTFESCEGGGGVDGAEKDGFVLVHASIREEQSWISQGDD